MITIKVCVKIYDIRVYTENPKNVKRSTPPPLHRQKAYKKDQQLGKKYVSSNSYVEVTTTEEDTYNLAWALALLVAQPLINSGVELRANWWDTWRRSKGSAALMFQPVLFSL